MSKNKSSNSPTNAILNNLKQNGIAVKIRHYRWAFTENSGMKLVSSKEKGFNFNSFGGETHVTLTMPDGTKRVGDSICSFEDQFSRREGIYWALARALGRDIKKIKESRKDHNS